MAVKFEVDVHKLNADIDRISSCKKYISDNLKSMFDEIRQLDAMWDGSANNAFNTQFNADYEMMLEVCDNLQKLIDSLEYSKKEYIKCENAVLSAVKSLKF